MVYPWFAPRLIEFPCISAVELVMGTQQVPADFKSVGGEVVRDALDALGSTNNILIYPLPSHMELEN